MSPESLPFADYETEIMDYIGHLSCILHRYQKITDQIVYLGYKISKSTVKNILIENGYDPEPDLTVKSTWHEFIKSRALCENLMPKTINFKSLQTTYE